MISEETRKKYFSTHFQMFENLLMEFFKKNSCGVILNIDGEHKPVGSGTFVKYQNRIFICTAAHLFRFNENREVIIGTIDCRFFPAVKIFSMGGGPNESIDMACLEIERNRQTENIFESAFEFERCPNQFNITFDADVAMLTGFPGQLYDPFKRNIVFMPYRTNFVPYSGWGDGADKNRHIYLSYKPIALDQNLMEYNMPNSRIPSFS